MAHKPIVSYNSLPCEWANLFSGGLVFRKIG